MDNGFFRTAIYEEHKLVLANEKRLTKLEFVFFFFGSLMVLFDLAVLIDFLFLGNRYWLDLPNHYRGEYMRFCILISAFVIDPFWIICVISKLRQLRKIKNRDYVVQRVMAVNMVSDHSSFWKKTVKVTFMSNDGMMYVTNIIEIVAKEMPLNKIGLLVRVNRSIPPVIYDECRFVQIYH